MTIRHGVMVRADASPPMLVVDIWDGIARCWLVDGAGALRTRFYPVADLTPLWLSLSPRSLWPDITHIDLLQAEADGVRAAQERVLARRRAKRARRSLKIQRRKAG